MGFIYKITSPTGRFYIGKTISFKRRMHNYRNDTHKKLDSLIMRSIRKYGFDAHVVVIMEEVDNSILSGREMYWIKELKSCVWENKNGMNLTYGGEGGEWKNNIERVKLYSDRNKGENGFFFGRKHTEEWKMKKSKQVSEYNKLHGVRLSKEAIKNGLSKRRKAVMLYDRNGMFVSEFKSITDAANHIKSKKETVTNAIRNNVLVHGKHLFRYKLSENLDIINIGFPTVKIRKKPIYWLSEDLEVINEFSSSKDAASFLGLNVVTVKAAAQRKNMSPLITGHIFCYKEDYLEEFCLKTA